MKVSSSTLLLVVAVVVTLLPSVSQAFTSGSSLSFRVPPSTVATPAAAARQSFPSSRRTTSLKNSAASIATAAADDPPPESSGGTATIPDEIFNLVKGIVGAGVLSLPAGIAAFGNAPSAVLPAVALIALIGAVSGYGFSLIGRVCAYTGATSYREAWTRSVDSSTSWLPAVSVLLKTMCAVLAYSMILADTTQSLLQTVGVASVTRTRALLGITTLVLLPLCWLKNLTSLAPFSLLGSLGMIYTTVAMAIRYFGKAYTVLPKTVVTKKAAMIAAAAATATTKFQVAPALQPVFGTMGARAALSPKVFILIGMLSTAYMAHFNAPKFYTELKNNTIQRYNQVVSTSFGISIALFASVATLGFLTFGSASSGLILNNYSTQDALMSFSRIAVAVSLVFSYPLAFVGVREGVLDVLQIKDRTNSVLNKVTVACLTAVTFAALKVKDVSFVLAFAGATLGNALIYVYPSIMFRGAVKKMENPSSALKKEAKMALVTIAMGIGMGVIGAGMALKSVLG